MTSRRWVIAVLASVLMLTGAAAGYMLGQANAPSVADADQHRRDAYGIAYKNSFREKLPKAERRGIAAGLKRGRKSGTRDGRASGSNRGVAAAQKQLDLIVAEQARLAAEAEAAERSANCGHVLFVEGACPTDEEVQREEDAESYCGGGDYETAEALGIEC